MNQRTQTHLLPDRYPTPDFFIADIFDNLPFKDDIASMAHPVFSLSTKPNTRNLEYRNERVTITIKPNTDGLPTIYDKDVLLYCASQMMHEINKGRTPPKILFVSSHDLLVATNRTTDGRSYHRLKKALDRLSGVKIKTNIKTGRIEETSVFGLIDSYRIVESNRHKDRMVRLGITLSDWFYRSIIAREVLTINRDYFRLRKPLERRLYEIGRKHGGHNSEWSISLEKLRLKTGITSSLAKFRYFIRDQVKSNHLPDYTIAITPKDLVIFRQRTEAPLLNLDEMPALKPNTIAKGARIVQKAETGWDYGEIRSQFTQQLIKGFKPDKPDGAFIAFVKKKVAQRP